MSVSEVIISGILLLSIDSIYLSLIKDLFKNQIESVQKSPLKLDYYGAALSYLFLIIGINYFVLCRNGNYMDAFVLGVVIYGVYEATSYALLKNWKPSTVVIDTIWGGILFALVAYLTKKIAKFV